MTKSKFVRFTSTSLGLLMLTLLFVPKAEAAEWPNILTGNNLALGSTGQGVVVLQGLLSELGFLQVPTGVALGYYGKLTQSAVASYQMSKNVTPSIGYFGPLSKIAMHQEFASKNWLTMLGW